MAENYNYDMQSLQQDAIRRAREMQARAQINTAPINRPVPPAPIDRLVPPPPIPVQAVQAQTRPAPKAPTPVREPPPPPVQQAKQQLEQHAPPEKEPQKGINPINDIFDMLLSDTDRTLILALILLLVEEKADTGLIFALMYLAI